MGIRIRRKEAEALGLAPGAEVILRIESAPSRVDLSTLPSFAGGRPDDSTQHDKLLGKARSRSRR